MKPVEIQLTENQIDLLQPLYDAATIAHNQGQSGMIIGQCGAEYPDEAIFWFVPQEQALKVMAVCGTKKRRREVCAKAIKNGTMTKEQAKRVIG